MSRRRKRNEHRRKSIDVGSQADQGESLRPRLTLKGLVLVIANATCLVTAAVLTNQFSRDLPWWENALLILLAIVLTATVMMQQLLSRQLRMPPTLTYRLVSSVGKAFVVGCVIGLFMSLFGWNVG